VSRRGYAPAPARRSGLVNLAVAAAIFAVILVATGGKFPHLHVHPSGTSGGAAAARPPAVTDAAVTAAGPAACGCQVTTEPGLANEQLANRMAAAAGWDAAQQTCLDLLWTYESAHTWSPTVKNPHAPAYGIPQADPGSKMASAGPDWRTDPATQVRWGLADVRSMYGDPCGAWSHELAHNWY
jgi:hypothetical protein